MKGGRRYRHYVSRSLIAGTADSTGRGWRLPAPEFERTVAAAACQILSDRTAIAAAAQAIALADIRLPSIFSEAEAWKARLQSEVEAAAALSALVDRVDLTDIGIRVSLKVPIPETAARPATNANQLTVTRFSYGYKAARCRDASGYRR